MVAFKKHLSTIGLFLILVSTACLCVCVLWNYKGDTSTVQNRMTQPNYVPGGQERPSFVPGQPDGQMSHPNALQMGRTFPGGMENRRAANSGSNPDYTPQLVIYAVVFSALSIAAYYFLIYKKVKINSGQAGILILILLGIGFFLRIYGATLMTGHNDINLFKNWAASAAHNLFSVYSGARSSDYPPLYMYVLFLIGKLAGLPLISKYYVLLLKLPSILADIATAGLLYKLARRYLKPELGLVLSAFYIFNPAVFINSTFWGQVDSFFTLIVVLALWTLSEQRLALSSLCFTLAILMKPQGIIFAPVLFYELIRQKNCKAFIKPALVALAAAVAIILPFSLQQGWFWIFKLFAGTVGEYPYASVNAFNLFALLGANYKSAAAVFIFFSYHTWGMIFITLITAYSWFIYIKGNSSKLVPAAALFQIAGVFTLATSMHERYLFPAVALAILAFIYLKDKRMLLLAAGFSAAVYINTHAVLFGNQSMHAALFSPALIFTAILNISLLVYLGKVLYDLACRDGLTEENEKFLF